MARARPGPHRNLDLDHLHHIMQKCKLHQDAWRDSLATTGYRRLPPAMQEDPRSNGNDGRPSTVLELR